jgi:hypothetical protein
MEVDSDVEALFDGFARACGAMRRVAAGESAHSVAAVHKVSVSSVIKWAQRQRRTGSVAPGKMGGHRSFRVWESTGPDCLRALREIRMSPYAACQGSWTNRDHGLSRDSRALPAPRGPELQKKTVLPAEQLRPKLARHRARWKAHQGKVDQSRLVFIDETWIILRQAQDQHGAAARLGSPLQAAHCPFAVEPLEDNGLPGHAAS